MRMIGAEYEMACSMIVRSVENLGGWAAYFAESGEDCPGEGSSRGDTNWARGAEINYIA